MRRCEDAELLDAPNVSGETLSQAYRQLQTLHGWLGNTQAVMQRLRGRKLTRVLDIGCGQGGLLTQIRDRLGVEVIGFDLRPAPVASPVRILTGNAVQDPLPEADVAVCVMMAHHLSKGELAGLIGNVGRSCQRLLLLDLVRHPAPLALFRLFVAPFLGRINALDGATSIRRAYTAGEMREIVDEALAAGGRPVASVRHTVAPFWIRQVVDISWEAAL
jgi:2-polyprenyl-3-methyl-5-hydroxy-6-metoxy-1,4-benzoquinol methylase